MFAGTGLLMLPSGLMTMVPDCAFAGRVEKANADKLKNNNITNKLEAILLNFLAFLGTVIGLTGK
jgi:hypothetical protein